MTRDESLEALLLVQYVALVIAATAFELAIAPDLTESRLPTDEELRLLHEVIDPNGTREAEVPDPT